MKIIPSRLKSVRLFIVLLLIALIPIVLLYLENFLTYTNQTKAKNIILEGWLKAYMVDEVYRMIENKKVAAENIYIFGWEYLHEEQIRKPIQEALAENQLTGHGVHLISNGSIELEIPPDSTQKKETSNYELEILVSGSVVKEIATHFTIFVNKNIVYSGFCSGNPAYIKLPVTTDQYEPTVITITFDNDMMTAEEDRNLSVRSVKINGKEYLTSLERWYFLADHPYNYKGHFRSNSHFINHYLIDLGIDASRIQIIDTLYKGFNKTGVLAKKFGQWGEWNQDSIPSSFNLITANIHARRSHLAFKRQAPQGTDVGVIAIPVEPTLTNPRNRIVRGIDEFMSYLYTWVLFH